MRSTIARSVLLCSLSLGGVWFSSNSTAGDPESRARVLRDRIVHGRIVEAVEELDRLVDAHPDSAEWLILRAECRNRLNQPEQAEADATAALRIAPNSVAARVERGSALHRKKSIDAAIEDFEAATDLDASHEPAWVGLGDALRAAGKLARAIGCYDKAIELRPRDAGTYVVRGIARANFGRPEEAKADFDRAISLDGRSVAAHTQRGQFLLTRNRIPEALADFDRVCELAPDSPAGFVLQADAYEALNEPRKALEQLDAAIERAPSRADFLIVRGDARKTLKDFDGAITDYRAAGALDKRLLLFAENRLALALASHPKEASREYLVAVGLAMDCCRRTGWNDWKSTASLAYVLAQASDFERAIRWQRRAIDLAPDAERAELRTRSQQFQRFRALDPPDEPVTGRAASENEALKSTPLLRSLDRKEAEFETEKGTAEE